MNQGMTSVDSIRVLQEQALEGRDQISQMARSGSLTPRFVDNEYLTAEIIYSTVHAPQRGTYLVRGYFMLYGCMSSTCKIWWQSCRVTTVTVGSAMRGEHVPAATANVPARENKRVCISYGSPSLLPASSLMPCLP